MWWYPERPEVNIRSLAAGFTTICEPPSWVLGPEAGALQKQNVPLALGHPKRCSWLAYSKWVHSHLKKARKFPGLGSWLHGKEKVHLCLLWSAVISQLPVGFPCLDRSYTHVWLRIIYTNFHTMSYPFLLNSSPCTVITNLLLCHLLNSQLHNDWNYNFKCVTLNN